MGDNPDQEVPVKYMLLIHQGTTPLPGTPEWDALSPEEQGAVYASYGEVNATPGLELSGKSLDAVDGVFDLVVANILANTLIELAPLIVSRVKDKLLLAGVLAHQKADVEAAYVKLGLLAEPGAQQGEWVRLDFHRG